MEHAVLVNLILFYKQKQIPLHQPSNHQRFGTVHNGCGIHRELALLVNALLCIGLSGSRLSGLCACMQTCSRAASTSRP